MSGWDTCQLVTIREDYREALEQIAAEYNYEIDLARVIIWKSGTEQEWTQWADSRIYDQVPRANYCKDADDGTYNIIIGPNNYGPNEAAYAELFMVCHEFAHCLIDSQINHNRPETKSVVWHMHEGTCDALSVKLIPVLAERMGIDLGAMHEIASYRIQVVGGYELQRNAMNILLGLAGGHWEPDDLLYPAAMPEIKDIGVRNAVDLMTSEDPIDAISQSIAYLNNLEISEVELEIDDLLHYVKDQSEDQISKIRNIKDWDKLTQFIVSAGYPNESTQEDRVAAILADQALPA